MDLLKWLAVIMAICAIWAATMGVMDLSILSFLSLCFLAVLFPWQKPCSPSEITKEDSGKLNESLYQLHKQSNVSPSMQVLFFHGFQFGDYNDVHFSTWKSGDGSCVWPQNWLLEEFPAAHIFFVSYKASVRKCCEQGSFDLHNIGENLLYDLMDKSIGQEPNCPVMLVGHSFGGLVIKQLCLQASKALILKHDKPKNFLENIKGIFYYGTPHLGISFDIPKSLLDGPLLKYVMLLSEATGILNFDFRNLSASYDNKWQIDALGENLPTKLLDKFHDILVPQASAREGAHHFNIVEDGDHFSLCRPRGKNSRSFYTLRNFLDSIAKRVQDHAQANEDTLPENFQDLPMGIVGIDHVVRKIKLKLDSIISLGLVGMGGIGKTTLAKQVFNTLGSEYEYTCFIDEVKNIEGGLQSMKNAVLENAHHHGKKVDIGNNVSSLQFLHGKRLLLVLDDASKEDDLKIKFVLQGTIKVDKGSRFVVTSRDFEVLKFLDDCYMVPSLDGDSSRHLFINLAFQNARPPPSLQKHVDDVVTKCEGLPLALEVLGKYLLKKSQDVWEQAIHALDTAENVVGFDEKLWATLKLSYDGLDELEQEMFLDAATMFRNQDLRVPKAIWGGATPGFEHLRWQHLVDLSLVREETQRDDSLAEDYTCIKMHEQLQSLGKKLSKSSRIWNNNVQAWERLGGENPIRDDYKDIVGLRLNGYTLREYDTGISSSVPRRVCIARNRLCKMEKLRYLCLSDVDIDEIEGEAFPSTLRWLLWLSSKFAELPFNPTSLKQLTVLEIIGCKRLYTLPASFGNLSSLQILRISGANLLVDFPDSVGHLSRLQTLKISYCHKVERLPHMFGNLSSLQDLHISHCSKLERLPETFGNLSKLERLELFDCSKLERLPETFGDLSSLQTLRFRDLCKVESLSNTFGNLSRLQTLRIRRCRTLKSLPETFRKLSRLQTLRIWDCLELRLPDTFGEILGLENLSLGDCTKLERLPDTFGNLLGLKTLEIKSCPELGRLPDTFGKLLGLKSLDLGYCPKLEKLPGTFGDLLGLEKLYLDHCPKLELPETFGNSSGLKSLIIARCERVNKLPWSVGQLVKLEYVELWETSSESILNSIENLRSLKTLMVRWIYIPVFPTLPRQLGGVITRRNYNRSNGWTFQIEDGKFNLKEDGPLDMDKEHHHQQGLVHDKVMKIVHLGDFRMDLEPLSQWSWGFLLQERGILKRLQGDMVGALDDLTAALDECIEKGEDNYECRKHRGLVRFRMGDLKGASVDGEKATELMPKEVREREFGMGDYGCTVSKDGSWQSRVFPRGKKFFRGGHDKPRFLGGRSAEYMDFKLN